MSIRKMLLAASSALVLLGGVAAAPAEETLLQFDSFYQIDDGSGQVVLCLVASPEAAGRVCQIVADGVACVATFSLEPGTNTVCLPQTGALLYFAEADGMGRGTIQPGNPGMN